MRSLVALLAVLLLVTPARADETRLDALFEALADLDEPGWEQIEDAIWDEWSETGSPTLDLLLQRGREAMTAGDTAEAIEHFTALVETAPDFAEGYNARATAYFEAGLYGPSLSDIVRVLSLEPRHFGALAGLGVILEETGDSTRALEAFRAALAIHPHRSDLIEAVERLEAELQGTAI
ncbi:MAG: tetratricopeptide repeat protein [Maritimibacter sp.]|nr:tetratricopeptide repeat protein [Maritimibacter sp.]